jgi:hypothetical protein
MHNMMHNMTDDEMIANYLVMRRGVCQYVRRVPKDLRAGAVGPRFAVHQHGTGFVPEAPQSRTFDEPACQLP